MLAGPGIYFCAVSGSYSAQCRQHRMGRKYTFSEPVLRVCVCLRSSIIIGVPRSFKCD
uniref:Uncharacterized protein n=1 Tax=Hyaloperonospora arabidopsidis (strain Emoy2) TaxID=559515 RepID=M4C294_HYAAE